MVVVILHYDQFYLGRSSCLSPSNKELDVYSSNSLSLSSTIPLISRTNTLARFRAILSATFNPFGKQKFSLSGHLANKSSFADGIGAVK